MKQTHYKVMGLTFEQHFHQDGKTPRDNALGDQGRANCLKLCIGFRRMVSWFDYYFKGHYGGFEAVRGGMKRNSYNPDGSLKDMAGMKVLPKIICQYDPPRVTSLKRYMPPREFDDRVKRMKAELEELEKCTLEDAEEDARINSLSPEGMKREAIEAMEAITSRQANFSLLPHENRVTILKALKRAADFLKMDRNPNEGA